MIRRFLSHSSGLQTSGFKKLGRTSIVSLSVLLILLISASCALAWEVTNFKVTPEKTCAGSDEMIVISGNAGPKEKITLVTTYTTNLDLTNGAFNYDPGYKFDQNEESVVILPKGTASCSLIAEGVKDVTISYAWMSKTISKTIEADKDGKVNITVDTSVLTSVATLKPHLIISGNAAGENPVKFTFAAQMIIKSDKEGYFEQKCCTYRPAGTYTIEAWETNSKYSKSKKASKTVILTDCSNGASTPVVPSKSSNGGAGTGEAKILTDQNTSSGNVSDTTDISGMASVADEDVIAATEQPETQAESGIFAFIRSILNWLGF